MSEALSSIKSALTGQAPAGQPVKPLHRLSGLGGVLGMIAALVGLFTLALGVIPVAGSVIVLPFQGAQLIPIPVGSELTNTLPFQMSTVFVALLSVGQMVQFKGARSISRKLGSSLPYVGILTALFGLIVTYRIASASSINYAASSQVIDYVASLSVFMAIFIILWQMNSAAYVDASKSVVGAVAGMGNALFFPLLAIGHVGSLFSLIVPLAYIALLVGQLCVTLYWWAPESHIREYARSTPAAKMTFGLFGFVLFLIGLVPLTMGPLTPMGGTEVWMPWSTYQAVQATIVVHATFATPPWAVTGFLAVFLFWAMLGPRLGAKELKSSHIRADVFSGGPKYFIMVMVLFATIASVSCSSLLINDAEALAVFLTICPAAALFITSTLYLSNNDVVSGLPLLVTSVFLLVLPYSVAVFILTSWVLCILTQFFLAIEIKIRGHTVFSQTFLTLVVTLVASAMFILFIIGAFGSGPSAIWPVNRWFNIQLLPGIESSVQAPTVFAIVLLSLIARNVVISGYAYGRSYRGGSSAIGFMTMIFALMIVLIAGNFDITHEALTAAAVIFALYAIGFVLVLSLNLNIGGTILRQGHEFEGNFVRVGVAVGLVLGIISALVALTSFAVFPIPPENVSLVLTLLTTLIVGLEIVQMIGWLSAGIRLGFLKGGFRFGRPSVAE